MICHSLQCHHCLFPLTSLFYWWGTCIWGILTGCSLAPSLRNSKVSQKLKHFILIFPPNYYFLFLKTIKYPSNQSNVGDKASKFPPSIHFWRWWEIWCIIRQVWCKGLSVARSGVITQIWCIWTASFGVNFHQV